MRQQIRFKEDGVEEEKLVQTKVDIMIDGVAGTITLDGHFDDTPEGQAELYRQVSIVTALGEKLVPKAMAEVRRREEFAKTFDINEDTVSLAHGKVQAKLREHFSGIELETLSEVTLFNVLMRISVHDNIFGAVAVGKLGDKILNQTFEYFDDLPEIVELGKYDNEIADEISAGGN